MGFPSGILGCEAPLDDRSGLIPFPFQGLDFPAERFLLAQPFSEAVTGENAELYFRHIQPTAVLGGVVKLQPPGYARRACSTPSSPPSTKRRLKRYKLDSATSKAWATLEADQPSPVSSSMRARVATRAGLLPARTSSSNRPRSSGVSLTANLSLTIPPLHNNTIRQRHSIPTRIPESLPKSTLTGY